jgi:hypothetical protein
MTRAVITGDIIQSTKIDSKGLYTLFQLLGTELKELNQKYEVKFEVFRGDSFQCLIKDPALSLRVALIIKTFIRSLRLDDLLLDGLMNPIKNESKSNAMIDARMTIGIGSVSMLSENLATSNGVAFQLSGRLLDKLKDARQHLAIASDDKYNNEWETESVLLDAIISKYAPD